MHFKTIRRKGRDNRREKSLNTIVVARSRFSKEEMEFCFPSKRSLLVIDGLSPSVEAKCIRKQSQPSCLAEGDDVQRSAIAGSNARATRRAGAGSTSQMRKSIVA